MAAGVLPVRNGGREDLRAQETHIAPLSIRLRVRASRSVAGRGRREEDGGRGVS